MCPDSNAEGHGVPANRRGTPHLFSVVIPVYNELNVLDEFIGRIRSVLDRMDIAYELIVVDDGSTDHTFDHLLRLNQVSDELKGIRLSRNFGKESALLAGLTAANGDVVVTIDGDLQHPPQLIPDMLDAWRGGASVIHAVKRGRAPDSRFTRLGASIFNALLSRVSGLDMRNASDYKLLDRAAVDVITTQLRERGRFYRGLADWIGFEQRRVPFDVEERDKGSGKWSGFALAELAVTAVTSFTSAPLRIITLLGVVTLVFGVIVSVEALLSWFRDDTVSGFVTIIITLLLIGSFIMISLGIIGEYIAKIYDEIKHRPVYVVESTCGFTLDEPQAAHRPSQDGDSR